MANSLFDADPSDEQFVPLAHRLRPTDVESILGMDAVVGPSTPLGALLRAKQLRSVILVGRPGSGKTTLAGMLVRTSGSRPIELSATSTSVGELRSVGESARTELQFTGRRTALLIDEIHRLTRVQQDALLPLVESGVLTIVAATTESPVATLSPALLSRCMVVNVPGMDVDHAMELCDRALLALGVSIDASARERLRLDWNGDARRLLNVVERAAFVTAQIDRPTIEDAIESAAEALTASTHYDGASALIKHLRASDADQAAAWLLHLLDAGEDPRFIARRLIIFASEDIGLAARGPLLTAIAAAEAVDRVGLPEARYALMHAALDCAFAPKSRQVTEFVHRRGVPLRLPAGH